MNISTRNTLRYFELVKSTLKVKQSNNGVVIFGSISCDDVKVLSKGLDELFKKPNEVLDHVRSDCSALKSCAYGPFSDFNLMVKTGLILGEKIVLWDILSRESSKISVSKVKLQMIGSNIVSLANLIEGGHVIVLPHPTTWCKGIKNAFDSLSEIGLANKSILPLVPSLVASLDLGLQPYTIVDSFSPSAMKEISATKHTFIEVAKHEANDLLGGMVTGLLASKVLMHDNFEQVLQAPISSYSMVIEKRKDFYKDIRQCLCHGGDNFYQHNYEQLCSEFGRYIEEERSQYSLRMIGKAAPAVAAIGALGGIVGVLDPSLALGGAIAPFIASLFNFATGKKNSNYLLSAVFYDISKAHKE